ncbi:MAG: hypothetical protein Q7T89_08295 [Anaerolineales bacterium]|nr:hypothetical protein [Anaerolineales bacterium]
MKFKGMDILSRHVLELNSTGSRVRIAHAGYMNGPLTRQDRWTIIFFALGWFMLCIGTILWIRSVFTIGAD